MSGYFMENYFDEADVYNVEQHKFIHAGHSGKGRSKREVQQRTNAYDPNGHTRKTMQKLLNNKQKQHSWWVHNRLVCCCRFYCSRNGINIFNGKLGGSYEILKGGGGCPMGWGKRSAHHFNIFFLLLPFYALNWFGLAGLHILFWLIPAFINNATHWTVKIQHTEVHVWDNFNDKSPGMQAHTLNPCLSPERKVEKA